VLPTSDPTLEELDRGRRAQAERLERELGGLHEEWSPLEHPLMQRWRAGGLSAVQLGAFAAEHYHAQIALAEAAADAARVTDGLLADQLERYATGQEEAVERWLHFAAATGWGGSAWHFGEDPFPETIACASAWRAEGASLAERLVTIWAAESTLESLSAVVAEAARTPDDVAVVQAGLSSLLPVTAPLTLVCRAELACRSYLELLDGVARQLSGA
jgi:hypothetical protein